MCTGTWCVIVCVEREGGREGGRERERERERVREREREGGERETVYICVYMRVSVCSIILPGYYTVVVSTLIPVYLYTLLCVAYLSHKSYIMCTFVHSIIVCHMHKSFSLSLSLSHTHIISESRNDYAENSHKSRRVEG